MPNFQLHPQLQQDCFPVGHLALSELLMMNDSRYPWFILVPRRLDIKEIYQLDEMDRQQLLTESCALAEQMQNIYRPDKLNIACIGNLVPQLHLHHVVRYQSDDAWPTPVWGKLPTQAYDRQEAADRIAQMQIALGLLKKSG